MARARGEVVKKCRLAEGVAVRRSSRGKEGINWRKELARLRKKRSGSVGKNGKGKREKRLEKLSAAGKIFTRRREKEGGCRRKVEGRRRGAMEEVECGTGIFWKGAGEKLGGVGVELRQKWT